MVTDPWKGRPIGAQTMADPPLATQIAPMSERPQDEESGAAGRVPAGPNRPSVPPGDAPPTPLLRARLVARVMDSLLPIPGTSWRVGLDPLLGLLPGAGDWIGWAVSLHLLVAGAQLGAGASLLLRMLGNLVLDAVTGLVPVLGDVFDAAWKANDRNLRLLEAHVARPERTMARSRLLVGGVLAASGTALVAGAWGTWWLLRSVTGWLF